MRILCIARSGEKGLLAALYGWLVQILGGGSSTKDFSSQKRQLITMEKERGSI